MTKGIPALVLAAVLFGMALGSKAFAQEETGFYIGGNLGFTRIDSDDSADELRNSLQALGFTTVSVTIDESDRGFKLLGGYQVNRNFAIEGYYANLGTYDIAVSTTGPVVTGGGELEVTGFGIDFLGMIPFNRALSGFARIGIFRWETEASFSASGPGGTAAGSGDDDGTELKLGIGVEWALTRNLRLRGEIEYYNFEEKLTMFSAGVVFRF